MSQFDVAALNYFVNPNQFQQTKFVDQLGCTNSSGAVIRWERSVLCSQWVNSQWGRACTALYSGYHGRILSKSKGRRICMGAEELVSAEQARGRLEEELDDRYGRQLADHEDAHDHGWLRDRSSHKVSEDGRATVARTDMRLNTRTVFQRRWLTLQTAPPHPPPKKWSANPPASSTLPLNAKSPTTAPFAPVPHPPTARARPAC